MISSRWDSWIGEYAVRALGLAAACTVTYNRVPRGTTTGDKPQSLLTRASRHYNCKLYLNFHKPFPRGTTTASYIAASTSPSLAALREEGMPHFHKPFPRGTT